MPVVPTLALFVPSDRQCGARVPAPREVAAVLGELERTKIAQRLNFRSQTAANTLDLGHAMDAAARLHRAGVRLGAGPDFKRSDGLRNDLEALVEASLSPLAAIRAATGDAARSMGAEREIGRVAPGLLGDLVIVDGDPGVAISSVRRVWQVVQGGRVIDRERLLAP